MSALLSIVGKNKAPKPQTLPEENAPLQMNELLPLRQLPRSAKLPRVLKLFRGESAETIYHEMSDFLKMETGADEVHVLRMYGEDFEVVDKPVLQKVIYSCKRIPGMMEVITKRLPVLLEKGTAAIWKGILTEQPDALFLIPVTVTAPRSFYIMGTAVLAYYGSVPITMEQEKTWNHLLDYLQLTVPLLINVKKYEESESKRLRLVKTLEALARTEGDIHDIGNCIRTVALEIATLLQAKYIQVLIVQQEIVEEKKLHKYASLGNPTVNQEKCPNPAFHDEQEDLRVTSDTCVGYVALNAKNLRVNSVSDLANYGISSKVIHSVGGCVVSNILCIPVAEHSGEAPLIVELSEKPGGFSYQDEEQAQLFTKRAAAILSSALLLDYKKKAIRRHGIRNEVLANIGEVSHFKVRQLLDLKFQYSSSFRKKLQDFRFSMRIFPDHQSPGVILYMFMDLGFVHRWQMRKSTLIRFILSMQQGYRDIPYHNWKHACCVTHFSYLLLKKLELVKLGYLTDLEALTLIISCLAHDIDHRGRNNHFNLCTKSELYHLYKQEDSIMERHHIAVALSVINSEDCNILQNLTDDEYKEFLDLIQWNILATDLAKYMQNRNEYFYTLSNFNQNDRTHRMHLSAVIMTASDLCDNVKTWDANLPCVKSIFHEFFAQGDDEIALGLKPMPMMDRRVAYIPQIEIQFITNIVRPAYQALATLLPQTKSCYLTLDYFEDLWLVSTSIFDENTGVDYCLQILDMKEMREEFLRTKTAPQLQTILEEHGIPAISIAQIGLNSASSIDLISNKGPDSAQEQKASQHKRKSSIALPPPRRSLSRIRTGCYDFTKNWLCCYICRNRGLVAARAVRKLNLADEYLDNRVIYYEKRRSVDSSGGILMRENTQQIY